MIKFEKLKKKDRNVSIQSYISPEMVLAIKRIGGGSTSGGLKIILESIKEDIYKAAGREEKHQKTGKQNE